MERCVTCHVRPEEDPGGAHARAAVGCSSCHLGNPFAFDKARAHAGMEPEPGALRSVERTCGRSGCAYCAMAEEKTTHACKLCAAFVCSTQRRIPALR